MATGDKNDQKRPKVPFKGGEGKVFTSETQPSPEAKKAGWERKRQERLLTQKILEKMTEGKTLEDYVQSLITNAKLGNSKAIDTINKGIEDQVEQIDITGNTESKFIILPNGSTIPV